MDNSNSNGVDVNNEILPESLHSPADSDIAQLHGSIICNKIEICIT